MWAILLSKKQQLFNFYEKMIYLIYSQRDRKTACYACFPLAFDYSHNKLSSDSLIIIVVGPLSALIRDQVASLKSCGIISGFIDAESTQEEKNNVNKGMYNILFIGSCR